MGLKLFDGNGSSDDETRDISKIEINEEFARRYEHNKQREDLQRLKELKKKGVVDDSSDADSEESSEEPSFEDLISRKKDLEFFKALIKVKNQDPVLKTGGAKLFESDSESADEEEEEEKRGRPMYLKDVAAKHLIEEGPEFEEREDNLFGVKTYMEELEESRKEFLDVVEAQEDDGGELLKVKERKNNDVEDADNDEDDSEFNQKLDEYFGDDDKLDENDKFLKNFFRKNKKMLDEDGGRNEDGFGVSEDEEEIERQEDYEREFNFRFEENAGDRVLGHSRVVEGSVRKKPNARKLQRMRKEERLAQEQLERDEELKHLKNLKKKQMNEDKNEKLRKIKEAAGIGEGENCPMDESDLDEAFNAEKYDKKMKEAFGDDYYEANDADPEFGSDEDEDEDEGEFEKPDFDKEDELIGLPKGWDDVYGSADGFSAVREKNLKRKLDKGREQEEKIVHEEGKQKKKRQRSRLEEEVINKELEEYYKLDYEDTIGDLKTRFKYRPVNAKRFGLSTEEVLCMDDKELNQYVSLKKLAPYREKEWKVPRIKTYSQKLRNKSLLEGNTSIAQTTKNNLRNEVKRSTKMVGASKNEKRQPGESNSDTNNLSRSSRRRLRQAELKLPPLRLFAYGKIPSKPKSKKKHQTAL